MRGSRRPAEMLLAGERDEIYELSENHRRTVPWPPAKARRLDPWREGVDLTIAPEIAGTAVRGLRRKPSWRFCSRASPMPARPQPLSQAATDIIDCKDPARGVVGAVADAEIEAIVATVAGRRHRQRHHRRSACAAGDHVSSGRGQGSDRGGPRRAGVLSRWRAARDDRRARRHAAARRQAGGDAAGRPRAQPRAAPADGPRGLRRGDARHGRQRRRRASGRAIRCRSCAGSWKRRANAGSSPASPDR
jgi:hypothetical protein